MSTKIILSAVYLHLFSYSTDAVSCFHCTNVKNGPCFDPLRQGASKISCGTIDLRKDNFTAGVERRKIKLDSDTKVSPDDYLCFSVKYKVFPDAVLAQQRGCLPSSYTTFCEDAILEAAQVMSIEQCIVCKGDLCNSAGEKVSNLACVIIFLVLSAML